MRGRLISFVFIVHTYDMTLRCRHSMRFFLSGCRNLSSPCLDFDRMQHIMQHLVVGTRAHSNIPLLNRGCHFPTSSCPSRYYLLRIYTLGSLSEHSDPTTQHPTKQACWSRVGMVAVNWSPTKKIAVGARSGKNIFAGSRSPTKKSRSGEKTFLTGATSIHQYRTPKKTGWCLEKNNKFGWRYLDVSVEPPTLK